MMWVNGLLGVLLIGAAIYGWAVLQRKVRGEDTPLFGATKRKRGREDSNDLEAFIVAYRSGNTDPKDLTSEKSDLEQTLRPAIPVTAPDRPTPLRPVPASGPPLLPTNSPGVFLRPEVKLAFLIFRSGLRDHHVFANVRLGDLGYGPAVGKVDLLVCDANFKYVATIDVFTGTFVEDVPKIMFLQRAGVRHLSLASSALPKPAQLREFLYGNGSDK